MTTWRKSSHSDDTGGQCVELARLPAGIGVRDSKTPEAGHFTLTREALAAFLAHVTGDPPRSHDW